MRKLLLCGAAGLGMTLATLPAWASPISAPIGPSYSKFDGVEQFSPFNTTTGGYAATSGTTGADCTGCVAATGGEGNWGIGYMDNIFRGAVTTPNETIGNTGTQLFASTPGGNEILFMFYGIHITSAPGSTPVLGNGGIIDLYWWDTNNNTPVLMEASNPAVNRTARDQYTGVTCANAPAGTSGCTLLARLDFVPGAQPNGLGTAVDPTVTVESAADPSNGSGQAVFYAEVDPTAGGAWASALAGQYFSLNLNGLVMPDTADIRNRDNFDPCGSSCNANWGDNRTTFADVISDPTQAFAVPEPATLSLMGSGLFGFGLFRRKRQKAKASAV